MSFSFHYSFPSHLSPSSSSSSSSSQTLPPFPSIFFFIFIFFPRNILLPLLLLLLPGTYATIRTGCVSKPSSFIFTTFLLLLLLLLLSLFLASYLDEAECRSLSVKPNLSKLAKEEEQRSSDGSSRSSSGPFT